MDDQVAAASRVLGRQTAGALGLLGGVASLFYLSAFVYGVSYFAGFGAPWLASEASMSRKAAGPVASFAALFAVVFLLARFRSGTPASRRRRILFSAVFLAVLCLFPLVVTSDEITLHNHSVLYAYAVMVAAAAGLACFQLSVSYYLESNERGNIHGLLSGASAVCAIFVLLPALQGRAIALADLADPSSRLPIANVRIRNAATPFPALLITSERVYCVDGRQAGPPRVRPVSWSDIDSINTSDHR